MRFLVDTNVLIDLFVNRETTDESREFLKFARLYKNELYATSMSIRDLGYFVKRATHSKEREQQAQIKTYGIMSKIVSIDSDDVINSLFGNMKDFEDSLISESAERNFCDLIITNNVSDFKNSRVPACTPSEIMRVYQYKAID